MKYFSITLIILISFVVTNSLVAQQQSDGEKNDIFRKKDSYEANKYNKLFAETNPDSVTLRFEIAQKACQIAKETKNSKEYIKALLHMGNVYSQQFKYELAMKTYLEALNICDSIQDSENRVKAMMDMRNMERAQYYFYDALTIYKKQNDGKNIAHILSSIALTYWWKGNLNKALDFLFESLKIEKTNFNDKGISRCYNNIGIVYHEKKDFESALKYLLLALEINQKQKDQWSTAETLNNLGENYISRHEYDKAMVVLFEAQRIAKDLNALVLISDNYLYLSRLYEKTNKYKEAFVNYKAFNELEDSIFNRNKYTLISELQASFEIEKKEQSIQLQNKKIEVLEGNKKIDRLQKTLLIGILVFIIAIGLVFFNRQNKINHRNKLLLQKDKEIQEAQLLLMEKEKEEKIRLQQELEQKNKFLIDFGLYIAMKNKFLIYLKDELKKLARKDINNNELKDLFYQLSQNLRQNSELIGLQENVEKVNSDFLQKLYERFPDITENEKHLLVFLRLNFSSKEISNIKAISLKAVEMSRYRLRKKFNLDSNESLTQFIHRI